MQQLVLDISSDKDASLIIELLKRFKSVEVNSFATDLSPTQTARRITAGLQQADNGDVKPWKEVKSSLLKRIKTKGQ